MLSAKRFNFAILGLFAIAMGFLEAIVVVYLRLIYYPEGFAFPLQLMDPQVIFIEWVRELATLVMLAAIGIIAGKDNTQRFFYFLYSFAVWDIFYYVALKFFLNWPESLLTWDILFLIPVTWVGPVLAPVICSLTMILFAFVVIGLGKKTTIVNLNALEWVLTVSGAVMILIAFMWDYTAIIARGGYWGDFINLGTNESFWHEVAGYQPVWFNWYLFGAGEGLIFSAIFLLFRRRGRV